VRSSKAMGHSRRIKYQTANPQNPSFRCMSNHSDASPPPDVSLLLRAHAEQNWLSREVIPVIRQLETRDHLPEEQVGAALAYLEVIWIEAQRRAKETDAAHVHLDEVCIDDSALPEKACRYHASVRNLREVVSKRVALLTAVPADASEHASARF
jgi:hypothetical protein